MKSINRLPLFKDGKSVGALERTTDGCRIIYDARQHESRNETQWEGLTFQIPWSDRPLAFTGVNLPPYFVGLLPEGLRMRALVSQLKTSEDDYFSLLAGAGTDPIGSVHFAADKKSDASDANDNAQTEFFKFDFKTLRNGLIEGKIKSQPLAGVQEKISDRRVNFQFASGPDSTILKLASPEFPNLVENEIACLQLAAKCGVAVNDARVVVDQTGETALAVTRFDRQWDAPRARWMRFHVEDACQFLNLYPADKYRISLQEIAKQVARLSFTPELEVLSLLRLYAFCYLVGNGDLHAKNISVIQKSPSASITLSPAYDLVCTALYGDFNMALKMDGKDTNFKRRDFIAFAERHGLAKLLVASMLDELLEAFSEHVGLMYSIPLAHESKSKALEQLWNRRIAALAN